MKRHLHMRTTSSLITYAPRNARSNKNNIFQLGRRQQQQQNTSRSGNLSGKYYGRKDEKQNREEEKNEANMFTHAAPFEGRQKGEEPQYVCYACECGCIYICALRMYFHPANTEIIMHNEPISYNFSLWKIREGE